MADLAIIDLRSGILTSLTPAAHWITPKGVTGERICITIPIHIVSNLRLHFTS